MLTGDIAQQNEPELFLMWATKVNIYPPAELLFALQRQAEWRLEVEKKILESLEKRKSDEITNPQQSPQTTVSMKANITKDERDKKWQTIADEIFKLNPTWKFPQVANEIIKKLSATTEDRKYLINFKKKDSIVDARTILKIIIKH